MKRMHARCLSVTPLQAGGFPGIDGEQRCMEIEQHCF
jgi:hypothetical protein